MSADDLRGLAAYDQVRAERPEREPCRGCMDVIHTGRYCSEPCRWLDQQDIKRAMGVQK